MLLVQQRLLLQSCVLSQNVTPNLMWDNGEPLNCRSVHSIANMQYLSLVSKLTAGRWRPYSCLCV